MKISKGLSIVAALSVLLPGMSVMAADIPLYPTGPAEDAAFIRFVNGGAQPLQVIAQNGQRPLTLDTDQPVSLLYPVTTSGTIKGTLVSGQQEGAAGRICHRGGGAGAQWHEPDHRA